MQNSAWGLRPAPAAEPLLDSASPWLLSTPQADLLAHGKGKSARKPLTDITGFFSPQSYLPQPASALRGMR